MKETTRQEGGMTSEQIEICNELERRLKERSGWRNPMVWIAGAALTVSFLINFLATPQDIQRDLQELKVGQAKMDAVNSERQVALDQWRIQNGAELRYIRENIEKYAVRIEELEKKSYQWERSK